MTNTQKVRLLRTALGGLEIRAQESEISPEDVAPLVELTYDIEGGPLSHRSTVNLLEGLEQRLRLLEATAVRHRVAGALFTEISDLHTEVLMTLAGERAYTEAAG